MSRPIMYGYEKKKNYAYTILYTYTIEFHHGKIFRARHVRIDGYRLLSNAVRTFVHLLFFSSLRSPFLSAFVVFRRNVLRLSRQCKCARKRGTKRLKEDFSERGGERERELCVWEGEVCEGRRGGGRGKNGCWLRANWRYTCAICSADIYTTLYSPFRTWTMSHEASHRVSTSVRLLIKDISNTWTVLPFARYGINRHIFTAKFSVGVLHDYVVLLELIRERERVGRQIAINPRKIKSEQ